ncbi:hypothetical protein D3C74_49660 [compost metagenome]
MDNLDKLETLLTLLVRSLNAGTDPKDIADLWVYEGESTTFNQALEEMSLPTLPRWED